MTSLLLQQAPKPVDAGIATGGGEFVLVLAMICVAAFVSTILLPVLRDRWASRSHHRTATSSGSPSTSG